MSTFALVDRLRHFIFSQGLEPGDRLPTHRELCDILSVGARPLREALVVLNQEGLIETRRRGGTFVNKPTLEPLSGSISRFFEHKGYEVNDIITARAVIESAMAAEAAHRRTAKDLLSLLATIEQMELLKQPDAAAEHADQAFHLAVLQATHNPVLSIFGQLIKKQFQSKIDLKLSSSKKRMQESVEEHRRIYTCLEKRQAGTVRNLMYQHIMYLGKNTKH